jgi:hypothetical protein
MSWFKIHPKVKALALAVAILVLGSLAGSLNGTVSWHDTAVADVTAAVALVVAYLKGA